MTRVILALALICSLTSPCFVTPARPVRNAPPSVRVTAKSVWSPTREALSDIRRKCSEGDPAQHQACFLAAMKSAGASDEAMAFVKEFAPEHGLAFIRAYRDTGRVDVAYIEYLYRANDIDGVLLVNGTPPIIDVDDYKFISKEDLRKNADYAALLQKYPNANIFPGDRYHTEQPKATTSDNGQVFQVEYLIQNGCHACERIGTLQLAFEFDRNGNFVRASIYSVRMGSHADRHTQPSRQSDIPEDTGTEKLNTGEIHSKVGASFTITLPANHTTGYSGAS